MKRATAQRLGESNRLLVLNQLRRRGTASMDQLVRDTDRSQPTVQKWLHELERLGLVRRSGVGASSGGRPPTLYEYGADAGFVLGVAVEIPSVTVALLDLRGRSIATEFGIIERLGPPTDVLDEIHAAVHGFLARHGVARPLVGAGLAYSGFIDRDAGLSVATPRLEGWQDVAVRADLETLLGCPVVLNHHIDALTSAELHLGGSSTPSDFLFFDFGYGLGIRAVRGSEPLVGRFGNAGLVGHTTVVPDGRHCLCGNRGCLEEYVSGRALLRQSETSQHDEDALIADTVARLFAEDAGTSERNAREELERFLAIGLANAINTFEQPRVVLSGFANVGGASFRDRLQARTRALLQATLANATTITFSHLPRAPSGARGAALFALRHHLPFADPLVVDRSPERSPTLIEDQRMAPPSAAPSEAVTR